MTSHLGNARAREAQPRVGAPSGSPRATNGSESAGAGHPQGLSRAAARKHPPPQARAGEQGVRQLALMQRADEWRLPLSTAAEVAGMFAPLGDPSRVLVLHALAAAGELRVSDLAEALGRDASTISHQLRVLRDHHLVTYEKRGRVALYRLADSHVLTLFQQALAHTAHQSPVRFPLAETAAVGEAR